MALVLRGEKRSAEAWPALMSNWGHLIPRYPGPDVVPLARLPAPALLNSDDPVEVRARECAQAYRVAVHNLYGWCVAFPAPPQRSWARGISLPDRVAIGAAAGLLTRLHRPPVAWCAFSTRIWLAYHGENAKTARARKQQPPIRWVFSEKRIKAREDWYSDEYQRMLIGKVTIVPAQRELMRRYEAMRAGLLRLVDPTQQKVSAIINQRLSPRTYEKLVREARAQVSEKLADYEDRMQLGEYIW